MNIVRRFFLQYPMGLLYVAVVTYSRRKHWLALASHATFSATFVIALVVTVVYVVGQVGAVP